MRTMIDPTLQRLLRRPYREQGASDAVWTLSEKTRSLNHVLSTFHASGEAYKNGFLALR